MEETAATVIGNVRNSNYGNQYMIRGVLMDKGAETEIGRRISDVEFVASGDTVIEYVCREWMRY